MAYQSQSNIELLNLSEKYFLLSDYTLADGSRQVWLPDSVFAPGERIVLCPANAIHQFTIYGKSIGVSDFPSLNNNGDEVIIVNYLGDIIDHVEYTNDWYGSPIKKDGGYALEMINSKNICAKSGNWTGAELLIGGSPGQRNTVEKTDTMYSKTDIDYVIANSSNRIDIYFSERMNTNKMNVGNFALNPNIEISSIDVDQVDFSKISLNLSESLVIGKKYDLNILSGIEDCLGKEIVDTLKATVFFPAIPQAGDLSINEILFNPRSGGVDFIELYNASDFVLNLKNIGVVNQDSVVAFNYEDAFLLPGKLALLCSDFTVLSNEYDIGEQAVKVKLDLPSLPDDRGEIKVVRRYIGG